MKDVSLGLAMIKSIEDMLDSVLNDKEFDIEKARNLYKKLIKEGLKEPAASYAAIFTNLKTLKGD